jgi:hypothetical protein
VKTTADERAPVAEGVKVTLSTHPVPGGKEDGQLFELIAKSEAFPPVITVLVNAIAAGFAEDAVRLICCEALVCPTTVEGKAIVEGEIAKEFVTETPVPVSGTV